MLRYCTKCLLFLAAFLVFNSNLVIVAGSVLPDLENYRVRTYGYQDIDDVFLNYRLINVKFRESSQVRLRNQGLISLANKDLSLITNLLSNSNIAQISRLSSLPEATIEQLRLEQVATGSTEIIDLSSYFLITLQPTTPISFSKNLIAQLEMHLDIETVYPEPVYSLPGGTDIPPDTPLMTGAQTYLGSSPFGLGAAHVWLQPGGQGQGVTVVDIERGWQLDHEDLSITLIDGTNSIIEDHIHHGTASIGIISSLQNAYGMTGIAPSATAKAIAVSQTADPASTVLARAIQKAIMNTTAGDIILIELQAPGPGANPIEGDPCLYNHGYIPPEYWEATFDAIKQATNLGRIVVQPAGNGALSLDDPRYTITYRGRQGNAFDRTFRDSGSIIVGAGYLQVPTCFTNFGSRVDLQGQGELVATTGYDDFLQIDDPRQYSTSGFNGTSAAAPIVVGAAAVVQGLAKARGTTLTPSTILQILRRTGTSQPTGTLSKQIGPYPNLLRAMGEIPRPPWCNSASQITRTSVASNGDPALSASHTPSVSGDGRYIAFQSAANNLPGGDYGSNFVTGIFVYDRLSCFTTSVAVSSQGAIANGGSWYPAISVDGRYVAYMSEATNLVQNDNNGFYDVFLHDRETGETRRVSKDPNGQEFNGTSGLNGISISGDGRFVSFDTNLCPYSGSCSNVWLYDRISDTTSLISIGLNGEMANGSSGGSSISEDGRYVAFSSSASNLVENDTNTCLPYAINLGECGDVFVFDRQNNSMSRVSVGWNSEQANDWSSQASISPDGRFVAFISVASNLLPVGIDTNICGQYTTPGQCPDVFVYDRLTGTIRVSVASNGLEANSNSFVSSSSTNRFITSSGLVTFESNATNLAGGPDLNQVADIFLHDILVQQTRRISVDINNNEGTYSSSNPSISRDGNYLAFDSDSALVPADANGFRDVYLVQIPPRSGPSQPNASPIRNRFTTNMPILSWSRIEWATEYEIQVDNNPSFTSPIDFNAVVASGDTSIMTSQLNDGNYYWRVRARNSNGQWGAWSATDSFVVDAY